ncbi:metal-dependent hydrolase [Halovenus rubra]|uniref:Metal-dependent hydrolase n=2 Tax=Halovenus rubra TaxID=869890 RepID=A0ACC7E0B2_9EURY|nr:metal-dependent hydrolase [Halovenus rubra]
MPNYPTHARWGRIGAVVVALAVGSVLFGAFGSPVLALAGMFGAGAATFVGAIFPDIDHHKSIPRRKAVKAFQFLVACGIIALAILSWDILVEMVDTAVVSPSETAVAEGLGSTVDIPPAFVATLLVLLVVAGFTTIVDPFIGLVTHRHRGWTHSVPVTFALTTAIAGALWLATSDFVLSGGLAFERQVTAVSVIGTFFVGILIHLSLDGEIV